MIRDFVSFLTASDSLSDCFEPLRVILLVHRSILDTPGTAGSITALLTARSEAHVHLVRVRESRVRNSIMLDFRTYYLPPRLHSTVRPSIDPQLAGLGAS